MWLSKWGLVRWVLQGGLKDKSYGFPISSREALFNHHPSLPCPTKAPKFKCQGTKSIRHKHGPPHITVAKGSLSWYPKLLIIIFPSKYAMCHPYVGYGHFECDVEITLYSFITVGHNIFYRDHVLLILIINMGYHWFSTHVTFRVGN